MIGELSILSALISSILSMRWKKIRHLTALSIASASMYLLYIILTHNFQYSYVYEYTSRDLSPEYLISAFWAGQDGSLLLWILILSLLMIKEFGYYADRVLNFIQLSLIFILYKSDPFFMLAKNPGDGLGLNPLLQNPWMVIHPPIVFIAYALLTIPLACAISALLKREYDEWIRDAKPWVLSSWIFLTLGLAIGGYWAYEVLGWGGYWSWDPVESSSLIPWLMSTALLHGIITQKNRGGMKKANIILSIGAFTSVIYAAFVTRSGIIESVHAFSESPIGNYYLLLILTLLTVSFLLFITRMNSITQGEHEIPDETTSLLTILTLCASAFAIFWGITFPVIWNMLTGLNANLGIDYYNQTNIPITILLLSILCVCISRTRMKIGFKTLIIISIAFLVLAVTYPVFTLLALCIISTLIHASRLVKQIRGGHITHIGISILLIGVVVSSLYSTVETVSLTQGQKKDIAYDYSISLDRVDHDSGGDSMLLTEYMTLYSGDSEIKRFKLSLAFTPGGDFKSTPDSSHIIRSLDKDTHILFQGVSGGQSIYVIKFIPAVILVWLGIILTVSGSFIALIK